jgi:hypothetical protein
MKSYIAWNLKWKRDSNHWANDCIVLLGFIRSHVEF